MHKQFLRKSKDTKHSGWAFGHTKYTKRDGSNFALSCGHESGSCLVKRFRCYFEDRKGFVERSMLSAATSVSNDRTVHTEITVFTLQVITDVARTPQLIRVRLIHAVMCCVNAKAPALWKNTAYPSHSPYVICCQGTFFRFMVNRSTQQHSPLDEKAPHLTIQCFWCHGAKDT